MTDRDVSETSVAEGPASGPVDHPPFRMRERRRILIPDLRLPSLEEIRWAARHRRERRDASIPQPRREDLHVPDEQREQAAVAVATEETLVQEAAVEPVALEVTELEATEVHDTIVLPDVEPAVVDVRVEAALVEETQSSRPVDEALAEPELTEPELAQLRPWHPAVLPDPEPVTEAEPAWIADVRPSGAAVEVDVVVPEPKADPYPAEPVADSVGTVEPAAELPDEELPPLVSHALVVREPAPVEPGQIAVLDEADAEIPTVTRIVPLPVEGIGDLDSDVGVAVADTGYVEAAEDVEPDAEDDRRAAPLYWRVLRLRYTRPNGWLRALYFEGAVALAVVLVLAEAASVWTIVVLPIVVAVVVKANDVLAGSLRSAYRQPGSARTRR